MEKTYIPQGYAPCLNLYDTQKAIAILKRLFEDTLGGALHLRRVSAPLFVEASTGLNDDLNGVERPVSFDIPAAGHDWGEWQTLRQATEDAPGEQERTCKTCGATQTREVDYQGDMPKTGVFTVPTAWLVLALALSLGGYIALKRKSERG